jgi:hypothetical protein
MSDDQKHPNSDDGLPPPNRVEPPPEVAPYELAPEPTPSPPPREPTPGKLADAGLTDDFPEDTDFDADPEVERALKGEPAPSSGSDESIDEDLEARRKHRLVKSKGDPKAAALIGGCVALVAMFVAAYRNSDHWFYASLLSLYMVALNTITGVAAIGVVAYFESCRLGKVEHAAARMLIAVSVATVILSLGVSGYNVITAPLGIAAYLGVLAILFHWTPVRIIRVAAVHAAMIAALYFGMLLYHAAARTEP